MISDNCTLCDLTNILQWYESSPKDIQKSEQHKRTKVKIEGLRAIHEDSSEVLIANLAEEVESKYNDVNYSDLQKAHSLMINRITKIKEELKVYSKLIQKVDEKMEQL
ncbi:hypothetical protein OAS49_03240 [Nitrosopumilus sp.]|nr:hypothetical protein [Nitrosopumilus sp.]